MKIPRSTESGASRSNSHRAQAGLTAIILYTAFCIALGAPAESVSNIISPSFTSISLDEQSGSIQLTWDPTNDTSYRLESSVDLISWNSGPNVTGGTHLIENIETLSEARFFRLSKAPTGHQNILLIIVDDWGIDSSPIDNPNGPNLPSMPNLKSLAESGIRFQNAYALAKCSPTRASIMTGRYPFRHGIGSPAGATLPSSELTLPEVLKDCSPYALGSFGKWHLGGGTSGPRDNGGWPTFAGSLGSGVQDYYNWQKTISTTDQAPQTSTSTNYTTTDTTNDAIEWIATQADQPWFCWLAYNAAHSPFHAPPNTVAGQSNPNPTARNNRDRFETMLWAMDAEIGRLIATIDRTNTNIILLGDNGTPGGVIQSPFDRSHSKGTLYEGGTHVPMIVTGPIVPTSNSVSEQLVHCVDLFPTIVELAAGDPGTLDTTLDGLSLLPILGSNEASSRAIACEAFGRAESNPGRAIRSGDYKLIIFDDPSIATDTATLELYHLPDDPNESNNLLSGALTVDQQIAYTHLIEANRQLGGNFNN